MRSAVMRSFLRVLDREKARQLSLIEESEFFNASWYFDEYPDVANSGADAALHYLGFGARELRDPGPSFSTAWYVRAYLDIPRSAVNPLVHYLQEGKERGLSPIPPRGHVRWWEEITERRSQVLLYPRGMERLASASTPVLAIPVCNADIRIGRCLASLRVANELSARIIVVFDKDAAPPADEMRGLQEEFPLVEWHENVSVPGAMGIIATAAQLAGAADLLVLDPDAIAASGWMRNMRIAALRDDKTGLVVAMLMPNGIENASAVARAVMQTSLREYPRARGVPVPAIYFRSQCLREIRPFEVGATDLPAALAGLVERAAQRGWGCIIDDSTAFLPADLSFAKAWPSVTANDEVATRISERLRKVERVVSMDPDSVMPRMLFVLSTRQGGTPQTNRDLMAALADRMESFVLHSNASTLSLFFFDGEVFVELEKHVLSAPIKAFPHCNEAYDEVVANWLVQYAIELVHIRHIAWHGLGLVDVSKMLGIPVIFSFHDFYTICPTVKLLDENNVYCAGRCTATPGACKTELWDNDHLPLLKHATVFDWRANMQKMLLKCDSFITTSEHARNLASRNFPFLRESDFSVIPHGRDFSQLGDSCASVTPDGPLRLLFLGGISVAKGGRFLEDLAKRAHSEGFEIHVLGTVADDVVIPPHVIVHGPYVREDVVQKIGAIRPHLGAVLSIWPETYCHTLTEFWAAGVPVVGFDLGAVGERIRDSGAGWLVEMSTSAIVEVIHRLRNHPEEQSEKIAHILEWQERTIGESGCRAMSDAYYAIYKRLAPGISSMEREGLP